MLFRTSLLSLAFLLPQTGDAAHDNPTVEQLLEGLGQTSLSKDIGSILRSIILAELASDTPAFCPDNGQGSVDAGALREFAIAAAPTPTEQAIMSAQLVVIKFLKREYPCE